MRNRVAGTWLCLALLVPSPAWPEPLGRLFFTPEQRTTLDRQRQLGFLPRDSETQRDVITLNGWVQRSSGHHTTWINGRGFTERDSLPEALSGLKAGETLAPGSRRSPALLGEGSLVVHHPPQGSPGK